MIIHYFLREYLVYLFIYTIIKLSPTPPIINYKPLIIDYEHHPIG